MEPEGYQARGLYDPSAPDAEERLALLDELVGLGATLDEIAYAERELHVAYVPLLLAMRSGGLTLDEVAARTDATAAEVSRTWQTLGLAPGSGGRSFDVDAVEMLRAFADVGRWLPPRVADQLLRTIGAAAGQIAEAAVAAFLRVVHDPDVDTGSTDLDRARFNAHAVETLRRAAAGIDPLLDHHLRAAVGRWHVAAQGTTGNRARFAVGFVDLVGYTTLTDNVSEEELEALVERLENGALSAVSGHGGRVVKLIGDAVMFVALDGAAACDIALSLVETFEEESRTTPRGGLAIGQLVGREGDFYGPAVNLASRIADQAVPDEVLVTDEVRADVCERGAALRFEAAGRRMLKGFERAVKLWTVQRGSD